MKKKKVVLAMAAAIILLSLLFREHFIQIYVSVFHGSLEKYSVSLLEKDEKLLVDTAYGRLQAIPKKVWWNL